jgi:hypothetical protein
MDELVMKERTFKLTITDVCENTRMQEPSERFGDTFYFIDSPSKTIKSFDKLYDNVAPMNADGTYFCGPREYKLTIKKYEKLTFERVEVTYKVSFSEGLPAGNEVVLELDKAPTGKVRL